MLLSLTQLALRRGLTLLVLVLILATGVALCIVFPVPELIILSGANGTLIQDYHNSTSSPLTLMDFTLKPWGQRWLMIVALPCLSKWIHRVSSTWVFLVQGCESYAAGKIHGKRGNPQDQEKNVMRASSNNQLSWFLCNLVLIYCTVINDLYVLTL